MKRIFLGFLAIGFLGSCTSEAPKSDLDAKVERIENGLMARVQIEGVEPERFNIEERIKDYGIPGVSIAVAVNGELEWARAYGMADSSENRELTSESLLLAASMSKPVSATRAHQLMEEGRLDLDANVNDYLTSWHLPDNEFTETEKVTTRRILNHTAGLTVWGFPGYDKGDTIPTVPQVLDGEGNTDSVRVYKVPGESWQYSGGGYTIMQQMFEDIDGARFPDLMQEHVLDPLGMTGSTYENPLPEDKHHLAATGYRYNGDEVEGKCPIYTEMAAAGLWTTPSELVKWLAEMQRIYLSQEDGLLKAETVNEMLEPGFEEWGLGPYSGEHLFGHGGADEGFRSRMAAWKDTAIAVVVIVNSDNGDIIPEIYLALADEYGLPGIDPTMRSITPQTDEQLSRFAGTYYFERFGEAYFEVKDGALEVSADFFEFTYLIKPENDTMFFSEEDGQLYNFSLEGDSATAFEVDGFVFERTK